MRRPLMEAVVVVVPGGKGNCAKRWSSLFPLPFPLPLRPTLQPPTPDFQRHPLTYFFPLC
jgi:hypothetical protein